MHQRKINTYAKGFKVSLLLGTTLLLSHTACLADDFRFVKAKNDIRLYEREILYQEKRVREVKAEFVLSSSPADVIQLIRDEKRIDKWNSNIGGFRVIDGVQPSAWTAYTRFDLPWPFDDQEMVLLYHVMETRADHAWDVQFSSTSNALFPLSRHISRVNYVKGSWHMQQLPDNKLKITYRILSERKEDIPRYISDPIVRDHLLSSLHRMKTILEP